MKKDKKSNSHTILLCASIPLLVLILMLLLSRFREPGPGGSVWSKSDEGTSAFILPELAEGVCNWNGELARSGEVTRASTESIAIPGYSNIVISSTEPYLPLINPNGNSVYMVYAIFEGDTMLFETGAIAPDKELNINLYELLDAQITTGADDREGSCTNVRGDTMRGSERDIVLRISTYDCTTYEPCNGATQTVHVTVR